MDNYLFIGIIILISLLMQIPTDDDEDKKTITVVPAARESESLTLCEELTEQQEYCKSVVGAVSHDTSACDSMELHEQELCIAGIAPSARDLPLCFTLSNRTLKNICISDVGAMTRKLEDCAQADELFYAEYCAARIAVKIVNATICEQLTILKNSCRKAVAQEQARERPR